MSVRFNLSLAALLAVAPGTVLAFDCEFYRTCCEQLVEAYREAGMRGAELDNFARTCTLHHALDGSPGAQTLFCVDAWAAMSREAWQHYLQGRIGFYPNGCMADPMADPDAILPAAP